MGGIVGELKRAEARDCPTVAALAEIPETRRAGEVRLGQAAAELLGPLLAQRAGLDPLEHEEGVVDLEHLGCAHRSRLGQPCERFGLQGVLARVGVHPGLHERFRAAGQHEAVGLVDVAPADTAHLTRAGRQSHATLPARISSSSPSQAACTRSSTSSKPPGAP